MRLANSRFRCRSRAHAPGTGSPRATLAIAFALACLLAPIPAHAVNGKHQATGTILLRSPSGIVMLKKFGEHTAKWDFVLTHDTEIPDGVAKGARVTIHYHYDSASKRIAERIKVISAPAVKKPG